MSFPGVHKQTMYFSFGYEDLRVHIPPSLISSKRQITLLEQLTVSWCKTYNFCNIHVTAQGEGLHFPFFLSVI